MPTQQHQTSRFMIVEEAKQKIRIQEEEKKRLSIIGIATESQARKQMEVRADGMEDRLDAVEKRIEGLEVKMAKVIELLDEVTDNRKDWGFKKKIHEGENDSGHVDEIGDGIEPPWKPAMETNVEQGSPEDSPVTATEGGAIKVEAASLIDLGEVSLSYVTVLCNREKKDEDEESSEAILLGESSSSEEDGGVTVKVMGTVVDGDVIHPFGNEKHDRFGKERKAGADWNSLDLGHLTEQMGQAQSLIFTPIQMLVSTSDLVDKKREVLKVISEKENKLVGLGWSQKKVDLTFNLLGQTHNFIITPTIFTNSGGVLQVEKKMDQKKLMGSNWDQNPDLPMKFKAKAMEFKYVGDNKIEVDVSPIVISFRKNSETPILYFLLKSTIEHKAFDPRGSFSIVDIARSSCIKLWDPGGRPLMIVFLISSP